MLQGHERSITQIKYNREGDLLFSVAKDNIVNVWYTINGERYGIKCYKRSGEIFLKVCVMWTTGRFLYVNNSKTFDRLKTCKITGTFEVCIAVGVNPGISPKLTLLGGQK